VQKIILNHLIVCVLLELLRVLKTIHDYISLVLSFMLPHLLQCQVQLELVKSVVGLTSKNSLVTEIDQTIGVVADSGEGARRAVTDHPLPAFHDAVIASPLVGFDSFGRGFIDFGEGGP